VKNFCGIRGRERGPRKDRKCITVDADTKRKEKAALGGRTGGKVHKLFEKTGRKKPRMGGMGQHFRGKFQPYQDVAVTLLITALQEK